LWQFLLRPPRRRRPWHARQPENARCVPLGQARRARTLAGAFAPAAAAARIARRLLMRHLSRVRVRTCAQEDALTAGVPRRRRGGKAHGGKGATHGAAAAPAAHARCAATDTLFVFGCRADAPLALR
jgi:hypothetical protein